MQDPFENKILGWIGSQWPHGLPSVLLAVSGGMDSVAMCVALNRLAENGRLPIQLAIGHVNHGLRGDQSDADEKFVSDLAKRLHLPCHLNRWDVRSYASANRLSVETAARILRLKALAEQCKAAGCKAVATAHHLDDQAETVVHRFMRGTGFRGLCGIHPSSLMHGCLFIRPMLSVSRCEIETYSLRHELAWCKDATNDSLEPTRNRIRHRLLPELKTDWPDAARTLAGLAQRCQTLQASVDAQAADLLKQSVLLRHDRELSLARPLLVDCPPWVFYEVIRQTLVQLNVGLRDYTQSHFDKIRQLTIKASGRHQFPGTVLVRAKSRSLTFEKTEPR